MNENNTTRRQVLLFTACSLGVSATGCTEFNPLVTTPCQDVKTYLRRLDNEEYEKVATEHFPSERDPEGTVSEFEDFARFKAGLWGLTETDLESVECTCVGEQSPEALREKFRNSLAYSFPYTGEITAVRFVRYEITFTNGESTEGLSLLFKLDGEGWYHFPLGGAARSFSEECF